MAPILKTALHSTVYALSEVCDVRVVQPRHRDPSIGGHVNVSLLGKGHGLLLLQTGEAEVNVSKACANSGIWCT
jgi:hypothetical protein